MSKGILKKKEKKVILDFRPSVAVIETARKLRIFKVVLNHTHNFFFFFLNTLSDICTQLSPAQSNAAHCNTIASTALSPTTPVDNREKGNTPKNVLI